MHIKRIMAASAVLAIAALVGCESGEPAGKVSGVVTYNSDPVTEGQVEFTDPDSGVSALADLGAEGKFELWTPEGGLPPGTYKVTVIPPQVEQSSGPNSPPEMVAKDVDNIPRKYRNLETTDLEAEVTEGENTFEFELGGG